MRKKGENPHLEKGDGANNQEQAFVCILFPKIRGAYAYSKQWIRANEQKDGRERVSHRDSVIYNKVTVRGVCLLSCFSYIQLFAAL